MTQKTFEGLNVVVTGGSGGLGKAIVDAYVAGGARVISADVANEDGQVQSGSAVIDRHLDVTREESWVALMDFVDAELGGIDILVNNAGIYRPNIAFEEMPLDVWKQHFAINSDGVFLGCKHAILRMKQKGGGAIVNMGSGMSITANPTGAAYCGSKAAVLMTTRTAARSAGRYGIRINAVLPGAVPTKMLMGNMTAADNEQDFLAAMESYSPLGRLASPEDIAQAVLFLTGPGSKAITGVFIPVDGGNIPGA